MAGYDDADGIEGICQSDGARGVGLAEIGGQLAIAECFPGRNPPKRRPDLALERRAAAIDRDGIQRIEAPLEIGMHGGDDVIGSVGVFKHDIGARTGREADATGGPRRIRSRAPPEYRHLSQHRLARSVAARRYAEVKVAVSS